MTDKEAILILCKIYYKLRTDLARKVIHRSIVALNFKMEVEKFADKHEFPEYFEDDVLRLIEQIKEYDNG